MRHSGKPIGSTFVPRRPPPAPVVTFYARGVTYLTVTIPTATIVEFWLLSIDGGGETPITPLSVTMSGGLTYYMFEPLNLVTDQNTLRAVNLQGSGSLAVPADSTLPPADAITDLNVVDEETDSTTVAWATVNDGNILFQSQFRNDLDEDWTDGVTGQSSDLGAFYDSVDNTLNAYGYRILTFGSPYQIETSIVNRSISNVVHTDPLP